jgi:multidrug transporter EmrE-like cation transporter
MSYLLIGLTILLTVYGQIVIKWQVNIAGAAPDGMYDKAMFVAGLLPNIWVVSALAAALLASLTWIAAISRLELSHAYPFTSLSFVLIMLLSGFLFNEPITVSKLLGTGLVVAGIIVGSQG